MANVLVMTKPKKKKTKLKYLLNQPIISADYLTIVKEQAYRKGSLRRKEWHEVLTK